MMLIPLLAIGLFALRVEAGLKVYFETLEIVDVDPKYLNPNNTHASIIDDPDDPEQNMIATSLDLVKKPPADAEGHFVLTGRSMGKYTLPTGVDLKMELCDMLDEPIIMGPFFAVLGFTKDSCPPEPGVYAQEAYKLPTEALPDEFPENSYMAYVAIVIKDKPMMAVKIFTDIQYD